MPFFFHFLGQWFRDKVSESTEARALVLLNLNNRNIEVVYIVFCYLILSFKMAEKNVNYIILSSLYLFTQNYFVIKYITEVVQNLSDETHEKGLAPLIRDQQPLKVSA